MRHPGWIEVGGFETFADPGDPRSNPTPSAKKELGMYTKSHSYGDISAYMIPYLILGAWDIYIGRFRRDVEMARQLQW